MSASQDKKKRIEERQAGVDKRSLAEKKEAEEQRKRKVKWTAITAVVALLVIAILLVNSSLFYAVLPSVTVGDVSYTNGEYQYFYYGSYYSFCNSYSSYLSIFFDTSKPRESQNFDPTYLNMFGISVPASLQNLPEGKTATWADYFREVALENMAAVTAAYEKAVAEGYTLSEEDSATIESELAKFDEYAASNNLSGRKAYISAAYGRGCTEKTVRKLMEMQQIASAYSGDVYEGFTYAPEELTAWYGENKDSYDTFDYLTYTVAAETVEVTKDVTDETSGEVTQETANETTEETMAAAKADADALAKAAEDEDAFRAAVADYAEDASVTESTGTRGASLSSAYSEWMLDSARRAGDVTVVENSGSGYTVVMFLGRDDNSYETVSVRHILIKAVDSDGDGAYGDEEKAAAKAAVEELYSQWKAGDKTEDSFAALANEKTEDVDVNGAPNTDGGLYENIAKGQMVEEFNDFCFASGRKPGDTAVLYGESSNYTGYHLVYFVGYGERYCDYIAEANLRNDSYTAWNEELVSGYAAKTNLVFKFAEK